MRFDIVTIFPGFFESVFAHGIVRRAQKEGLVTVEAHDLREFAHDRHRTVDDRPFGGGEGMVLKPEPLAEALERLGVRAKERGSQGAREQGSKGASHPGKERRSSELVADRRTAEKQNAGPSTPVAPHPTDADLSAGTPIAATSAQGDGLG